MKLIVGLGNPGKQYAHNRHNVGFMALDYFAQQQHLSFIPAKAFQSLTAEFGPAGALLAKPQTQMNNSGQAVSALLNFYKLDTSDCAIVYDELALPFGTVRIRAGGSSAGHNGVESIIKACGDGFVRIRIGIANPRLASIGVHDFVLADFSRAEQAQLPAIFDYVAVVIDRFIKEEKLEPHSQVVLANK